MNDQKSKRRLCMNQILLVVAICTLCISFFSVFISLRSLDYNKRAFELTNSTVAIQKKSQISLFIVDSLVDVYYDDNYVITKFCSIIANDGGVTCQLDEIIYTYNFEGSTYFVAALSDFSHNLEDEKVRTSMSSGYSTVFDYESYKKKRILHFKLYHEITDANWVLLPSGKKEYNETHEFRYGTGVIAGEPYINHRYNLTNVTIEFIYHDKEGIQKEKIILNRRDFNYFHPNQ